MLFLIQKAHQTERLMTEGWEMQIWLLFLGDFIILFLFPLRQEHRHVSVSESDMVITDQVWFSPKYIYFFVALQFQRNTSPVFEQVKTSGCTWANRVNPSTYFSKQSLVQRCPTVAC